MSEWAAVLNGVYLTGSYDGQWEAIIEACEGIAETAVPTPSGLLSEPPSGLGLPGLRTEDVTYAQRDGVRHFRDWYEPRIITLANVTVCPDGCPACTNEDGSTSARRHVQDIITAWSRPCNADGSEQELVIYTDCYNHGNLGEFDGFGEGGFGEEPFGGSETETERALNGPYGIVGRPRVADLTWVGNGCAVMTLRFDSVDQRIYVLDDCGTPGFTNCSTIEPGTELFCTDLPLCFDGAGMCFPNRVGGEEAVLPIDVVITGTQCVAPTITLFPTLTRPRIENLTTSEYIIYNDTVEGAPVIINTDDLTATQNGESRTHLLTGSGSFSLDPGEYQLRMLTQSQFDDGYATFCFRPTVVSA